MMKIEQFALQDEGLIQIARGIVNTDQTILAKRRDPKMAAFHNMKNIEIAKANAVFAEVYKKALLERADALVADADKLRDIVATLG